MHLVLDFEIQEDALRVKCESQIHNKLENPIAKLDVRNLNHFTTVESNNEF